MTPICAVTTAVYIINPKYLLVSLTLKNSFTTEPWFLFVVEFIITCTEDLYLLFQRFG